VRNQILGSIAALLAVTILAGCSSSLAVNLRQDEINVAIDSSVVAKDQIALQPYLEPSNAVAISCATQETASGISKVSAIPQTCPGSAAESKLKGTLRADELKLKVARDQVNKDESG
jgi:hypothetical protein